MTEPVRLMLDGTPCWCVSADKPHEGWVHSSTCQAMLRERVGVSLGKLRAAIVEGDRRIARLSEMLHPTLDGYCPECSGSCLLLWNIRTRRPTDD